jgi:nitroreductase
MNHRITPVRNLTTEQVRSVLEAAIAAPSLHNSQPWRFRCTSDAIELYADLARELPAADPDHRELMLACGAALLNLRLAVRALGNYPDTRLCPDPLRPELVAVVRPEGTLRPTPTDRELAAAIPRRRTNRRPFDPTEVPTPLRHQLRRAAEAEHAWLASLAPHQLPMLRALAERAYHDQQGDRGFRAEWAHWTGRKESIVDGVPARSGGPLPEPQDDWVLRDFSGGQAARRVPGKDFEPRPLIAVVGSFHDQPLARLQAGQAMQRVLLTATAHGLAASFLSHVVEVAQTRLELRLLIGGGLWPQAVLRVGYGSPVPPTPRRAIDDVLDNCRLGHAG